MQSVVAQKPISEKSNTSDSAHVNEVNHETTNEFGTKAGMPLFLQRTSTTIASPAPEIQRMYTGFEDELAQGSDGIQAKLTVGAPNDEYEQEADIVADQVMRMPAGGEVPGDIQEESPQIQTKPLNTPLIQRLCVESEEEFGGGSTPSIQTEFNGIATQLSVPHSVKQTISSPGGGSPLNKSVRSRVETVLGADLSGVRVHSGTSAQIASLSFNAKAFAHQNNIFLGKGQSASDVQLMAHEAAHVVQQSGTTTNNSKVTRKVNSLDSMPAITKIRHWTEPQVLRRPINPIPVARKNRLQLIGDGTAANPGIKIKDLRPYVAQQADWFSDSSLTTADRDMVWNMLRRLDTNPELRMAAAELRMAEVDSLSAADQALLNSYAQGFNSTAQTIRLSTQVTTVADAKNKGSVMNTLATFVPPPVMRVVIPESGLNYLITNSKTSELQTYYNDFLPTLEHPGEWSHIETLLTGTVAPYNSLKGWISDLHIFTTPTLSQLMVNVGDFSRSKPVLLVLFSATDWNSAFLQGANMETAVLNVNNLALVLQGRSTLAALTTSSSDIARDYGEQEVLGINWSSFSLRRGPGRLGQVVIAGHGSDTSVDMGISGAAPSNVSDTYVSYTGEAIDSATNTANTQNLIDTLLNNMDPSAARIVFAGCLVGSHDFPASMNLSNTATAAATLRSHLASSQNLRDFVNARMTALGVTGDVLAASGSTPFSTFNVSAAGQAELSLSWDPNVGGSPEQYVQTGAEPEGALRAALETYADSRFGPTTTTNWMRTRAVALTGDRDWYKTQTRSAYQVVLPATGDVLPAKILEVSHRVEPWLVAGWASTINVTRLAGAVHAGEQFIVFNGMLASEFNVDDHLKVGVQEAWMSSDATHVPNFAAALTASSLKRRSFRPLMARSIVNPHLGTLLTTGGAPTRGQLVLALTIAVDDNASMPTDVRTFLRAAAGGSPTSSFPAALNVPNLLDGSSERTVLENIGLAAGTSPAPALGSSVLPPVDANIDLNRDSTNERFIAIGRRMANVTSFRLRVRSRPTMSASTIHFLRRGDAIRVMGATGAWSLIDHNGKVGFVGSRYIT